MEATTSDTRVQKAICHFLAARQLQDRTREFGPMREREMRTRYHVRKVAAFARELCGSGERGNAQPLAAMPAR